MDEVNPYAPPTADEGVATAPKKRKAKKGSKKDIEAALVALEAHIANPEAVRRDLKESGGRVRTITYVMLGLAVLSLIIAIAVSGDVRKTGVIVGVSGVGIFGLIGGIALALDLSVVSRSEQGNPVMTLKSYLRAIATARYGYSWATLCPTARERSVNAPQLGPVSTGIGAFTLDSPASMKAYAATFARPGNGNMRGMQFKTPVIVKDDGDVATVAVPFTFQSWPQWAQILMGVGGAFGAQAGSRQGAAISMIGAAAAIVGLIGMFAMRKKFVVTVQKTMLRASNGVWYVYDADVTEGAPRDERLD